MTTKNDPITRAQRIGRKEIAMTAAATRIAAPELQDGDVFSPDDGKTWYVCAIPLFGNVAVYVSARRTGDAPTVRVDVTDTVLVRRAPAPPGKEVTMTARLPHTVAFTVLRDEDRTAAYAAIARFGKALSVEETEDGHIVAVCATQRGEGGAYRLHSIGCDHRALPCVQ